MEGAPSRDARPPPAGRGADFWRQFCAGGRTALLSDISEPFPLRCSELACLDELAFFAGELSNLSESFPSRCSELACRILPRLTQPSRCIPQYFATRISLLAMTHLGDTAVSHYSPARAAGQAPTRIEWRLEATPPWPLGSARAGIGNRGPSASRPRVGGGWRSLNRRTRAESVAATSR